MQECSLFSTSSPALTVVDCFDASHSNQCEMILYCSFDLQFSNNEQCWASFLFFNFILFLNFTILYWFCHILKWIRHRHTRVPHPEPSSLPIPSPQVVPVHQPQASSIVHWTWIGDSFHTWYYTYFNAILPNHLTLSLSHRVQKTVLYISVSFAVSYTGLLLPSL